MSTMKDKKDLGIAVIFTLAILSLVIISALLLISTAEIERKASNNYNSLQFARIVAQSGLQKAMLGIQLYASDFTHSVSNIYSYDPNATSAATRYTEYLGGDTGLLSAEVNGVQNYVNYSTTSPPNAPVWIYIATDTSGTSPLIARYAFRIIPTTGMIDPSACIDSGYNASISGAAAVTEANTAYGQDGTEYTSLGTGGTYVVGRPGKEVNEIFLRCMDTGGAWLNTGSYLQNICSSFANPAGQLVSGDGISWIERWPNLDTLFSKLIVSSNHTDSFRQYFIMNEPPDPEAYWGDNGDSSIAVGELFHRFNISRNDWSSVTPNTIIDTASATAFNSVPAPYDGSNIPWITYWDYSVDSGNYTTAEAKRSQIAANIIDYCDIDTAATTDSSDFPTYVGNEKCPYINEVRLKIDGTVTVTAGSGSSYRTYSCTAQISEIDVEVVDMYGSNLASTAKFIVSGQYNWVVGSSNPYSTNTFTDTYGLISIPQTTSSNKYKYGAYTTPIIIRPSTSTTPSSTSRGLATSINNFSITSLRIKLYDPSTNKLFDYSFIIDSSTSSSTYTILSSTTTSTGTSYPYTYTGTCYIDYQVADPRQNLHPQDWGAGTGAATNSGSTANGTLSNASDASAKNSLFVPNPGGNTDPEPTATQPWELSTAFIRNGPMQSPWELGFIHRGTKWQTLNLKKFDPSKGAANATSKGGGAYSSGDANILDQIKMTSDATTYGKINVNTNSSTLPVSVLKALFEKISVGCNISSSTGPGTLSGTEISSAKAQILATSMQSASAANTGGAFYSRAEILSTITAVANLDSVFCEDKLGLSQNTDAKKEEIIGKFINLTKAEKTDNVFTVIAVAQTLKDLLLNANSSTTGTYDSGKDQIIGTQKILAVVKRDPGTNRVTIISLQYLN